MSRFTLCNCPAGFGAGAERHAPDCPGRVTDRIASTPVTQPLRSFTAGKVPSDFSPPKDFDPGFSAIRAAAHTRVQEAREQHERQARGVLMTALGMTAEEVQDNRHRITRHCHPDKEVFLLDDVPVVEIYLPKIAGDALVTSYRLLRETPAVTEPVPPLGVEPEVLAYICHGAPGNAGVMFSHLPIPEGFERKISLVDRAHVTRLQAEVERLKQVAIDRKNELTSMCTQVVDLQSELTKARVKVPTEAMVDAACAVCIGFSGDYGEHNDHLDRSAAVEVLSAALNA